MGIATSLLKAVEQYAVDKGYEEIYLHVETNNQGALKLYGKNGYDRVATSDDVVRFTEHRLHKPYDCYVLLHKKLCVVRKEKETVAERLWSLVGAGDVILPDSNDDSYEI
jgi:ribosomal protein S18 acetylase RimI-like enzyme